MFNAITTSGRGEQSACGKLRMLQLPEKTKCFIQAFSTFPRYYQSIQKNLFCHYHTFLVTWRLFFPHAVRIDMFECPYFCEYNMVFTLITSLSRHRQPLWFPKCHQSIELIKFYCSIQFQVHGLFLTRIMCPHPASSTRPGSNGPLQQGANSVRDSSMKHYIRNKSSQQ